MLRFLLILFVIYLIWQVVKIYLRRSRYRVGTRKPQQRPPAEESFDQIQDADFEDVSDEPDDK